MIPIAPGTRQEEEVDEQATDMEKAKAAKREAAATKRKQKADAKLIDGFANTTGYKCAATAILAWIFNSPVIDILRNEAKFAEIATLLSKMNAGSASPAGTTALAVNAFWKFLDLPTERVCVAEVLGELKSKLPGFS